MTTTVNFPAKIYKQGNCHLSRRGYSSYEKKKLKYDQNFQFNKDITNAAKA